MTSGLCVMVDVPVSGVATKIDAQKTGMKATRIRSTFVAVTQGRLSQEKLKA